MFANDPQQRLKRKSKMKEKKQTMNQIYFLKNFPLLVLVHVGTHTHTPTNSYKSLSRSQATFGPAPDL